jgi:hypothetical protein
LFIPLFGCREKQIKVKRVYLFRIFEMRFKAFDKVVPEQEFIFVKEPWKADVRE